MNREALPDRSHTSLLNERTRLAFSGEFTPNCYVCMDLGYVMQRPVPSRPEGRWNRAVKVPCTCGQSEAA